MLERIQEANNKNLIIDGKEYTNMDFSMIKKFTNGRGICYVRDGALKRTRTDKPYIVLYVSDVNSLVIPAYMFDIGDFMSSGKDLSRVIGKIICIDWEENYLNNIGLTLNITSVKLVEDVSVDITSLYCGTTEDLDKLSKCIESRYTEVTGHRIQIPFIARMINHMDFDGGKVGGIVKHYYQLQKLLDALESSFSKEQFIILNNTMMLYMIAHINVIKENEPNIKIANLLTKNIEKVLNKLETTEGIVEVVHNFFGYIPKDIYVRTVDNLSASLIRSNKEIELFKSLPLCTEGNAGYGTIYKYEMGNNE